MITDTRTLGNIAIVSLRTSRMTSGDIPMMQSCCAQAINAGHSAVLMDMSGVGKMTQSGIAAIIETFGKFSTEHGIGYFGCQGQVAKTLEACPLYSHLPIYPELEDALDAPRFRRLQLLGVRSVMNCTESVSRLLPVQQDYPLSMVDLAGRSMIDRQLGHLIGFGLRDYLFLAGRQGGQLQRCVGYRSDIYAHLVGSAGHPEDNMREGTAGALLRLHEQHWAFPNDFLVFEGHSFSETNLRRMLDRHKQRDADLTLAVVPSRNYLPIDRYRVNCTPRGQVVSVSSSVVPEKGLAPFETIGALALNPRVLDHPDLAENHCLMNDLLPRILKDGGRVLAYEVKEPHVSVANSVEYFETNMKILTGDLPSMPPEGRETEPGVWVSHDASVSRAAQITGPCQIGAGVEIEPGACIEGPCVIGQGSVIQGRSLLQRSIVAPDTLVRSGAWAEGMIVGPDWAAAGNLDHVPNRNSSALELIEPVKPVRRSAKTWPDAELQKIPS